MQVIFFFFSGLCALLIASVFVLTQTRALDEKKLTCKNTLATLAGLPDLALVSEAHFVRHRSLSGFFAPFSDGPELLEYFPSTFVYHEAPLSSPSRIENAH